MNRMKKQTYMLLRRCKRRLNTILAKVKGKTMKAAVLYGDEDFRYEDVADPVVSDNDVKIQVKACGVCGSDLALISGHRDIKNERYFGHEFSGIVTAVGPQ